VVVSTNTKNLQDQLFNKDLPFLEKSMPFKFQAALLKGRGNYICRRKWSEVLSDPDYYLSEDERTRALPLLFWVNRTTTGDIAENNGFYTGYLWSKFSSEAGSCSGSKCTNYSDCYLQNARKQAAASNIVVVNHALLLSDIASQNAVLGEYRYLVMDEAHNLEKAASNHLGKEANIHKLRAFCFSLYRKDGNEMGLLARLKKKFENNKNINELLEKAILETNRVRNDSGEFFGSISDAINLNPDFKASLYTIKKRYGNKDQYITSGSLYFDSLQKSLKELRKLLQAISSFLAEKGEDVNDEGAPGLELSSLADEALSIFSDLENLYVADDPEWVFWWEMPQKDNAEVYLHSAPLNPGDMLNTKMYPWLDTIIFTSATLSVAGNFDYFLDRLGLKLEDDKDVVVKNYGSPFDFDTQAFYCVPGFIPSPRNVNDFNDTLADLIVKIALEYRKGLLVLFTSYRQLETVYRMISGPLQTEGITILGQGMDGGRTDILQKFLRERAVLLGTDSFWQGIDAPGEALEILMIAKLPFDVPTEPLVQARSEKLENEGKNPFIEYSIPEAVIKLRQGIGRLIRSGEDKGVVLLCDNRIITTKWGTIFSESLPKKPEVLRSIPELLGAIGEFV
jgi:predicted DnaQ family exonuclease/DinG family helicase